MARIAPRNHASAVEADDRARPGWPTRLPTEIWLHRHGWALPIATLLALFALAVLVIQVEPTRREVDTLTAETLAEKANAAAAPSAELKAVVEPGQPLRGLLSQAETVPSAVKRIAELARQHAIDLPRAQYATSRQLPSGIEHTDISFNFVAGYPRTRAFVEDLLRTLPNASVDRLSFARDQAQGSEAEVTLKLTLWRWPAATAAEKR